MAHLSILEILLRVGITLALAGAVGTERELSAQPAGLRTHMLVATGSMLFTVSGELVGHGTDPTRIAAQVASGIGFLGGGAILREGVTVRGLTTAATLWATAAIGLAVGLGDYAIATITTGVMLSVLVGLKWLERMVLPRRPSHVVVLELERKVGLRTVLQSADGVLGKAKLTSLESTSDGRQRAVLRVALRRDLIDAADVLCGLPDVRSVEIVR